MGYSYAVGAALVASFVLDSTLALAQSSRTALSKGAIAITGVSVIPMTADTVLRDQTVVVRDGRIAALGPKTRVPSAARRVDGKGKYLIPGLADMHAHLFADDAEVADSAGEAELGVFLANGVTAARLMIGVPQHFELKRAIETGTIAGPQLWIASPQFVGRQDVNARVITTPDEARTAVREVKAAGYDFIKLTLFITPEVYDAVVAEAAAQGVPVIGHVDPRVGVPRALAAGQHIEHLDNYMETVLSDSAPTRVSVSDFRVFQIKNWETLDFVDDRKVEWIAGVTARSRTFSAPTLSMFRSAFAIGQPESELRARPDWDMMPAYWRRIYLAGNKKFWSNPPSEARRKRYVEVRSRMVKAIVDSGGYIMTGSDGPGWLHVYGWALHRELQSLVLAGLTPYQALTAATVNPAAFFKASKEWGTIEPGKRADLVLLSANPLDDISNTTRIEAVAVGGRWFERAELDRMVRRASVAIDGIAPDSLRAGAGGQ